MPMSNRKRRANGRYLAEFDAATLYEIVRAVTLLAAQIDPLAFPDATAVTVRAFNRTRLYFKRQWGAAIPKAMSICKLLADAHGAPWAWEKLLRAVHDPD